MNIIRKALASLLVVSGRVAYAQDPWLHIYYPGGNSYQTFDMSEVLDITFDETTGSMIVNTPEGNTVAY
ncbi:MAG: hypothetical protein K2F58_01305, partial [Muribaculaceae bacterium]|nr:hypothetical protein [Muribaculaceae bacterium]